MVTSARVRITASAVTVLFLAADVVLTAVTRDPWATNDGIALVGLLGYVAVGYVIARTEPRNPIGWILLGFGMFPAIDYVARLYLVLDYRERGGRLPLGTVAVFFQGSWSLFPLLFGLPVILLFPDGRLSSRWLRLLQAYAFGAITFMILQIAGQVLAEIPHRLVVDVRGNLANENVGVVAGIGWLLLAPLFLAAWIAFVWHQVSQWRSSSGVLRAQLKWLAVGSVVFVVSSLVILQFGDGWTTGSRVGADLATLGISVMPVTVGVAILRYRLYEIDRLISRTLAYALLTAVLVGTFAGIVLLTTRVLPFSSPVAVAASTLAVAALFSPLRRRVQQLVDRRFNRARYDRDALVALFGAQLRDAVDSETVVNELVGVAASSVQPAHLSVWVRR